jgi:hypothetical protein
MQRRSARRKAGQVRLALRTQNETSGGSSDTEAKEFTVSPSGCWVTLSQAVTVVTPVAK